MEWKERAKYKSNAWFFSFHFNLLHHTASLFFVSINRVLSLPINWNKQMRSTTLRSTLQPLEWLVGQVVGCGTKWMKWKKDARLPCRSSLHFILLHSSIQRPKTTNHETTPGTRVLESTVSRPSSTVGSLFTYY